MPWHREFIRKTYSFTSGQVIRLLINYLIEHNEMKEVGATCSEQKIIAHENGLIELELKIET